MPSWWECQPCRSVHERPRSTYCRLTRDLRTRDLSGQGHPKLTLADITEEGANLVALQTRQQLGISSLSFAAQSEQSVLALFR